jgi:hypothetical protein
VPGALVRAPGSRGRARRPYRADAPRSAPRIATRNAAPPASRRATRRPPHRDAQRGAPRIATRNAATRRHGNTKAVRLGGIETRMTRTSNARGLVSPHFARHGPRPARHQPLLCNYLPGSLRFSVARSLEDKAHRRCASRIVRAAASIRYASQPPDAPQQQRRILPERRPGRVHLSTILSIRERGGPRAFPGTRGPISEGEAPPRRLTCHEIADGRCADGTIVKHRRATRTLSAHAFDDRLVRVRTRKACAATIRHGDGRDAWIDKTQK